MSDTKITTTFSETLVPLGVAMIQHGENFSSIKTYDDLIEKAEYYNINIWNSRDTKVWNAVYQQHVRFGSVLMGKSVSGLIDRCFSASEAIVQQICPPQGPYTILGDQNAPDHPADFSIGGLLFSLKDGSDILWNTTPKKLIELIEPSFYEQLTNGELEYIQGRSIYTKDGSLRKSQPAFDWFIHSQFELGEESYTNFLYSFFHALEEIRLSYGAIWNPDGIGENTSYKGQYDEELLNDDSNEWWYMCDDYYPIPLSSDPNVNGYGSIPRDEKRIIFRDKIPHTSGSGSYNLVLYDGFNEEDYPTCFVGMYDDQTPDNYAIIPLLAWFEERQYPEEYFNRNNGTYFDLSVDEILNRTETYEEEYVPFNRFSITVSGNKISMSASHAKIIGRWISHSTHSPLNAPEDYAQETQTYWEPGYYDPHYGNNRYTEMEYWLLRVKQDASDELRYSLSEIQEIPDVSAFTEQLFRIQEDEYFYVKMMDNETEILRVPSKSEFAYLQLTIENIYLNSHQNTMIVFDIRNGNNDLISVEIEFRNKNGYFNGAPDMIVKYLPQSSCTQESSSLRAIYQELF